MTNKRSFFYIPTYALIIIFVMVTLSLTFEIFVYFNVSSFESITVNDIVYKQGEAGYEKGLKTMKNILLITFSTSLVFSVLFGYFSFKRIKNKKK